jgi:hypothetical protein
VDAAVGRASASGHDGPGLRSQLVDPVTGQNWLTGFFVGAERGPISFRFVVLIGNRAFDNKYEGSEFSLGRVAKETEQFVAVLVGEKRIVKMDLGNPWECTEDDVLDARLSRTGYRDGIPVASEPGGELHDVHFSDWFSPIRQITRRRSELRHAFLTGGRTPEDLGPGPLEREQAPRMLQSERPLRILHEIQRLGGRGTAVGSKVEARASSALWRCRFCIATNVRWPDGPISQVLSTCFVMLGAGVLRVASRGSPLRDLLRSEVHESVQISTRDNIRDENTFGDPHGSVQAPDLAFTMPLFRSVERRMISVEVQDLTL